MLYGSCYKLGCDFSHDPMSVTLHLSAEWGLFKSLGSISVTSPQDLREEFVSQALTALASASVGTDCVPPFSPSLCLPPSMEACVG